MQQRVALEDRAPDVPPCDALAEAVVLSYVLYHYPAKVVECELLPLLVFPEHRQLFQAMQHAYRADESHAQFYVRWLNEAERMQPGLSNVLDGLGASWSHWQARNLERDAGLGSVSTMDWEFWLARLRQVAAARRLLEDAQRMAERAWRGDVDGAFEVVGAMGQRRDTAAVWDRAPL